MRLTKHPTKRWASASVVFGSVVAVLASPLAIGSASAAPTAIQLSPHGTHTASAGTCQTYTVAAQDGTNPAAGETVSLTVTETPTTAPASNPITLFNGTCTTPQTVGVTNTGTGAGPYTASETLTLDSSGHATFGVLSSSPGTGTVAVSSSPTVSDQDAVTWTPGGPNAVTTLTSNPTTVTQDTGTTATYTVTATDAAHNPVQGVTVNEETNTVSSPDQIAPTACGTTGPAGTVTCTVHNNTHPGTDSLVFWVDNANGTTHTSGPDQGEPQTPATAVFNAGPPVSAANSTVTCQQQLTGANQGTGQTSCTVPTSQHAVVFTATVQDANHNPLSGVTVNFTTTSAKLGGTTVTGTNLPSGTGTTNASGQATFTVNDPSAADGDFATVSASVSGNTIGSATAHWAAAHATALSVQPVLQSVARGGTVTVKAQVVDQFGTPVSPQPSLSYVVTGRNLGKSGTVPADGTITYTDAGTVPAANTDTINVTDATDGLNGTATVSYVTSATASTVTIDTSGSGTSDANCGASGHTAATGVASGTVTEVCAIVKNSAGEPLAGKTVTFTVNNGQVANHGGLVTGSGTSYAATTDAAGVAFADVTSTKSGVQTVTATSDAATATGNVTYAAPAPAQAYTVAVSPTTAAIPSGGSQKFTATVTDKSGNPVPGVTVVFTQTGVGSIGNGNNSQITAADGTVNVTVTTAATDTGNGTLTFSIGNPPSAANQCATTGGTCSATANYTVAPSGATNLSLTATGARVGGTVTLTATATSASGPVSGAVVRFFVSGAQTINNASATTGTNGQATYAFTATRAGSLTIQAYVDSNNNQVREATEPKAVTQTTVTPRAHHRAIERPTIFLTSVARNARQGAVTIHVATHPNAHGALVRYFVKRHGVWRRIGTSTVRPGGHAALVVVARAGSRFTFRVTVSRTARTTFGTSPAASIIVR